jgi:hypothetical protein
MAWAPGSDAIAEAHEAPRGDEQDGGEGEVGEVHHENRLRDVRDWSAATTMASARNPSKSRPRNEQRATRRSDQTKTTAVAV